VVLVHGRDDDVVPLDVAVSYAQARTADDVHLEEQPTEHFGVIDPLSPAWPAVLAAVTGADRAGRAAVGPPG
jgi:hypothetical protein